MAQSPAAALSAPLLRDTKALTKAFFAAADNIAETYRQAVIKAGLAQIQADLKAQREKLAAAAGKAAAATAAKTVATEAKAAADETAGKATTTRKRAHKTRGRTGRKAAVRTQPAPAAPATNGTAAAA